MKKIIFFQFLSLSFLLLVGAGCSNVSDTQDSSSLPTAGVPNNTTEQAVSTVNIDGVANISSSIFSNEIAKHVGDKSTEGDQKTLPYMYESEKMAEDLFSSFSKKNKLPIFDSLSKSHANQKDVIEKVMSTLEIDLSLRGLDSGKYKDKNVQALYDKLLVQGNEMRVKAFTSGLLLEEGIIKNIDTYLGKGIDGLSKIAYEALKEASGKNMKVLNNLLLAEGVTYTPQVISQAEFDGYVN